MGLKVLVIPLILTLFLNSNGEFRFCYFGPQKISNKECPYGVYFQKPFRPNCTYYANDQTGPSGEAEVLSCNQSPKSLSAYGEKFNVSEIKALFIDVSDMKEKGELGNLASEDCLKECLPHWLPMEHRKITKPYFGPPTPVEEDYNDLTPFKLGPDLHQYHRNLTFQLFTILSDPGVTLIPQTHLNSAKILERSFRIFLKFGQPYVTKEFLDQVYKGFMYFVQRSKEPVNDLGEWETVAIDKILDKCEEATPNIKYIGVSCNGFHKITHFEHLSNATAKKLEQYIVETKAFHWGKYDIIVDATWATVDFVHAFCFPHFRADLNAHHLYQLGMEGLFTKTIQQRWPLPITLLRGDNYWNNVLMTKDAKLAMQNVDAIVVGGYKSSAFRSSRLHRPFIRFPGIQNNGVSKYPSSASVAPKVGWSGGLEEYWEWYKANSVVLKTLRSHGAVCIQSATQLAETRKLLEQSCGELSASPDNELFP